MSRAAATGVSEVMIITTIMVAPVTFMHRRVSAKRSPSAISITLNSRSSSPEVSNNASEV